METVAVDLQSLVVTDVVETVILRVYGGKSHKERESAASRYLDAMQEFNPPITCNAYECTSKTDASGNAYVQFRYFSF